jgi:DNA-binding transcriptional ArsR family regulator
VNTYQSDPILDALGDPTRRTVFYLLGERPQAVGELAAQLPVSRPAVSQHLRTLKAAGLVLEQAQGTRRIYRVNPLGLEPLRAYLDAFWTGVLTALKREAETSQETKAWRRKRKSHRFSSPSKSTARSSTPGKRSPRT